MEKKNNYGLIAFLGLIIILLVGYILYLKISYNELNGENNPTIEDNEDNDSANNQGDVIVEIKNLDLARPLNTIGITYQNASDVSENYGLSMNVDADKKSITLSIDWTKFCSVGTGTACPTNVENYQITGFSKEVISTFVGDVGQDSMGITLFYLMSDGTVEYTPLFIRKYDSYNNGYYVMNYIYEYSGDKIVGEHFVTNGSLDGVNDVIKIYNVDASAGSGWRTTIGATADGSFFDLGNVIKN